MEYFLYDPEFRLLCCRTCQIMVTQKQVKLHLRTAPHNLSIEEIKYAQKWASNHNIFQNQQEAYDNLPPRPDGAALMGSLLPLSALAVRPPPFLSSLHSYFSISSSSPSRQFEIYSGLHHLLNMTKLRILPAQLSTC